MDISYKDFYSFDCSARIRYILNSRTFTSLTGRLGYGHFEREIDEESETRTGVETTSFTGEPFDRWNWEIGADLTYRISIPTSLEIRASYGSEPDARHMTESRTSPLRHYALQNHEEYKGYSLQARIVHYIF
jgi:hypothetical protein